MSHVATRPSSRNKMENLSNERVNDGKNDTVCRDCGAQRAARRLRLERSGCESSEGCRAEQRPMPVLM